jgi:hypothetical protein
MWEQQNIEGAWEPQRKLQAAPETSLQKFNREREESRSKTFKLGGELAKGNMPMFMTGPEIKTHFAPFEGDKKVIDLPDNEKATVYDNGFREENDQELWDRKLSEAKMTGRQRYGEMAFHMGAVPRGISPKSSMESVAKTKGIPGFVSLETQAEKGKPQILGGHHRIALAAAQFKDHIFPVKYYKNVEQAQRDPGYK